jgi:hypothetical protein
LTAHVLEEPDNDDAGVDVVVNVGVDQVVRRVKRGGAHCKYILLVLIYIMFAPILTYTYCRMHY